MKNSILFLLTTLCTALSVLAAPIAYEGFNYVSGAALASQNGGSGWSSPWTLSGDGSTVGTPGLTYADGNGTVLPITGNTGTFAGNNRGNFRTVSTSPEIVGTSLYISFIADLSAATASSYAGLSLFAVGVETLFLGDANGPTTWGIDPKAGTVVSGMTPVTTQTFLVYRIDFLAGSAEIRLFENPTLGVEPAPVTATAFTTRTSALTWDTIRIQSGSVAGHTGVIDEIRIGTTYADVAPVPEPAGLAVLVIGGLACASRHYRG